MLHAINQGMESLEAYAKQYDCTTLTAAIRCNSPLTKDVSLWHQPKDLAETLAERQFVQLTGEGHQDILSRYSIALHKEFKFPLSTIFLHGMGCIASAMTKGFRFSYMGKTKPVCLYIVTAQPPSTGKSGINEAFMEPVMLHYRELNKSQELRRRRLAVELAQIEKDLDNPKDLDEREEQELFDRYHDVKAKLEKVPEWLPALDDTTIEGAENCAARQGGMYNIVSAEAEAVNVITGAIYNSDSPGKKNYGLLLKSWDGEYFSGERISRQAYKGYVRSTISVIAQHDSVDTIFAAGASGRGLSERFLLLSEPDMLGERDHLMIGMLPPQLESEYSTLIENIIAEDNVTISFSPEATKLIAHYRNTFEKELKDGGKYDHNLITGFMGKADKQVMKIASVLHGIEQWGVNGDKLTEISEDNVLRAISIFDKLAESYLASADRMGYVGEQSEIEKMCGVLELKARKGRLKLRVRELVNDVKNVKPFKGSRNITSKIKEKILPIMEQMNYCVVDGAEIHINPRLK